MADGDGKAWIIGGAVALAVGIGVYIVVLDDSDTGCQITASGVAVIATGLTHGRPAAQIAASAVAAPASKAACTAIVERLRTSSTQPVELEVQTPDGTGEVTVTAQLLTQAPRPRTTCDDWAIPEYRLECAAGMINPPIIDVTPNQPTCQDWVVAAFVEACNVGTIGLPLQE